MSCCCPYPRWFKSTLQPTTSILSTQFKTRLSKTTHRVVFFYDRPPLKSSCGKMYAFNSDYPLELLAYRQLGALILSLLIQDSRRPPNINVEACEYTNEIHLAQNQPLPPCNVLVNLNHDWPTIHEDSIWAANWLKLHFSTPACVPSQEQIVWLFEKTRYVEELLQKDATFMLPTMIVRDANDLAAAFDQLTKADTNTKTSIQKKLVCKENFSAGKEGVSFIQWSAKKDAIQKMIKLQKQVGFPTLKDKKVRHRLSTSTSKASIEKKKEMQAEKESMNYIDRIFVGGNKGVFMVQQYEKRFNTEHEKRLFYSKGMFLYAMSHRGWIGTNAQPKELTSVKDLGTEQKKVEQIIKLIPKLGLYPLVRFDFGPDALLSEIEVLPDLFGGPDGNVKGKKWEKIKMIIATAYVDDIIHQLGWYEGTESKETQQGIRIDI